MGIFSRFPSFTQLYRNAGLTFVRFPYTLISAIITGVLAAMAAEHDMGFRDFFGSQLLLTAMLGVPLFTALTVYADRQRWSNTVRRLFPASAIILLAIYYFSLPDNIEDPLSTMVRFLLLGLAFHFLVAFLPFLKRNQQVGFWQFNKTLFLRFLLAALYSAVVYVGLAIALAAADKLFGADVDPKTYGELFFIVAAIFNSWVFLSWVPTDLDALNQSESYPGGLKVFTQFILLPLVVLYFIILISYEAKIIITWNWPRGWVSKLILWYSVVGILSLLLLHPLQKIAENKWIAAFGRWYFRGSIPLVVLLFFAILERVGEYGITVNRYLVIAMAVGLAIVVLYFVFSRTKDIRLIPVVLFVLAIVAALGPWSAFSISESSQRGRLEDYLQTNGILENDQLQPVAATIALEDRIEMSSIIRYLDEWHGAGAFSHWIDDSTVQAWSKIKAYGAVPDSIASHMGFKITSRWQAMSLAGQFNFSTWGIHENPIALAGFDYLYRFNFNNVMDTVYAFAFKDDSCYVRIFPEQAMLGAKVGANRSDNVRGVSIDLRPRLDSLAEDAGNSRLQPEQLTFDASSDSLRVRFLIETISGKKTDSSYTVESMSARLLVGKK